MIFVLGIDAATWTVINPNIDKLPALMKLCEIGKCAELTLMEKPISPAIWCGMFSGQMPWIHGHESFVTGETLVKREDIHVDFIWDVLYREGKTVKVINVPFIVPPYSFGVDFQPIGFGLPTNEREWNEELSLVTQITKDEISRKPDLLISTYTLLDRIQHFHWGEDCVLSWYKKVDEKIGELIFETGFLEAKDHKLIVISDHGFCSFGEAKIQTLPNETEYGILKGDHHEKALLITININHRINKPQDVFYAIREEL